LAIFLSSSPFLAGYGLDFWPRQLFGLYEDSGTTTLARSRSSKTQGVSVCRAFITTIQFYHLFKDTRGLKKYF